MKDEFGDNVGKVTMSFVVLEDIFEVFGGGRQQEKL